MLIPSYLATLKCWNPLSVSFQLVLGSQADAKANLAIHSILYQWVLSGISKLGLVDIYVENILKLNA